MKKQLIAAVAALSLCLGTSALALEDRVYVDPLLSSNPAMTISNVIEDTIEGIPSDMASFKPYAAASTYQDVKSYITYNTNTSTVPWYYRMKVSSSPDIIKITAQAPCTVTYAEGTKAYAFKLMGASPYSSTDPNSSIKSFYAGKNEYSYDEKINLVAPSANRKVILEEGNYLIANMSGDFSPVSTPNAVNCYMLEVQAPINISVNGDALTFNDQPPMIKEGRTLVPVRAIFEAIGAKVEWDDKTKTVTATKAFDKVTLTINDKSLKKNGESIMVLEVPAQIINGRTMVPARAVAEAFNLNVTWDGRSRTVFVEEKK